MGQETERGFGARYNRAADIGTLIKGFPAFEPGNPELEIEAYEARLKAINGVNASLAGLLKGASDTISDRRKLFWTAEGSAEKLLAPIMGAVESMPALPTRTAADEAEYVGKFVAKIRGSVSKGKGEGKGLERAEGGEEEESKGVSRAQRSFGSVSQHWDDMVVVIEGFGARFNPANKGVKLPALKEHGLKMRKANEDTTEVKGRLSDLQKLREGMYGELSDVVQRMKSAVKSQYGVDSREFAKVKGISV